MYCPTNVGQRVEKYDVGSVPKHNLPPETRLTGNSGRTILAIPPIKNKHKEVKT
jgi:hypothetical protein